MTTTNSGAPSRGSAGVRRGSNFSDRQISQSVKDERAVEVTVPSHTGWERIIGWVYGSDDFHWGIVTTSGETYLVHKSAPALKITGITLDAASQGNDVRETVEPIISGYRDFVMREHFNKTAASN